MNKVNNGRVDIKTPNTSTLFQMYDKIPANQCATFRNPTEGLWDTTLLSQAFFSEQNIQMIQNGIRAGVYNRSNGQYVIAPQDCDSLKIIMRSIFLQYSRNLNEDINSQILYLNKLVLDYCINNVYNEAISYMKYLYDINNLNVPISHPIMVSNKHNNYEIKNWF
jgi:hypothetical protein